MRKQLVLLLNELCLNNSMGFITIKSITYMQYLTLLSVMKILNKLTKNTVLNKQLIKKYFLHTQE